MLLVLIVSRMRQREKAKNQYNTRNQLSKNQLIIELRYVLYFYFLEEEKTTTTKTRKKHSLINIICNNTKT